MNGAKTGSRRKQEETKMQDLMIQGIGFVGVLLFILSYQIKSNKALYIFQALGSAMFCFQFMLLGQLSGSFGLMMVIIRNALLARYQAWAWVRWKGWIAVFSCLCTANLIFTWNGPLSLLPFLAILVSTILYWTDNAQKIRLANLVCASTCWLLYDLLIGSWGGVLNELITLGSIVLSIYRYGWSAMKNNRFEKKNQICECSNLS